MNRVLVVDMDMWMQKGAGGMGMGGIVISYR